MKAKPETWTVVVAGGWNVRIFSPEWVAKHLMKDTPVSVEIALAAPIQLKFSADGLVLIPADDRLIAGVQEATVDAMDRAEEVVVRALELLPYTPTAAFGVNFGFEDELPGPQITELFRLSDLPNLSEFGCAIKQSSVTHRLDVNGKVLNVTHSLVDGIAQLHLNFHHDSPGAAPAALRGSVRDCFALATTFMSSVYALKVDEVEK